MQNLRYQKTELMGVGVSCEDSKNAIKFQISANLGWRHLLQVLLSKLLGNFLTSHIFAFLDNLELYVVVFGPKYQLPISY